MRKYLAAAALGAVLIASQAAADDTAVGSADDASMTQNLYVAYFGAPVVVAGVAALFAWAISQSDDGKPISP